MSKQDKTKDNYPLGVTEHLSNCVRDWFRSQFTFKLSMVMKKVEPRIEKGSLKLKTSSIDWFDISTLKKCYTK